MPPIRTIPPTKALKTERTHEENQERAYIAASRRSDRSLEARVESARRASEIHKRRTGRSLRVTEQDVVNEEMYEEEDDDLPMQYRRLTAHLQTGSADFNRRLSAYLTNHVAMRTALDQAITNSYAAQYPNAPQFAHNQQSMFPSPFLPQNSSQQASPTTYQPYPTPGNPNYRPSQQARSNSVSQRPSSASYSPNLPTPVSNRSSPTDDRRRTSAASATSSSSRSPMATKSTPKLAQPQPPPQPERASVSSAPHMKQDSLAGQMQAPASSVPNAHGHPSISPFSMSLPMESQMLLGSALDPNDPMTAMLMAGSENMPMPFNYNESTLTKPRAFHQPFDGMSATLAPSALDMSPSPHSYTQAPPNPPASTMHLGNFDDFSKGFGAPSSNTASGTVTPGLEGGWDAYIHDSSWSDNVT